MMKKFTQHISQKSLLLFFAFVGSTLFAKAQFSADPADPLVITNASGTQADVIALNDTITSKRGYFVFWRDTRNGNTKVYGQRLDTAGNALWETNGRFITGGSNHIYWHKAIPWQKGFLLTYVIGQDSVMAMYLDSNGHNNWTLPALIAKKEGSVIYVEGTGCLNNIATSTGATITYYPVFLGGSTAVAFNKIDFDGNVQLANNANYFALSGYDYRVTGDGADGFYALSKGNGIGSTITIDRINSSGSKVWPTGLEITGGSNGFAGGISMAVNAAHDLYVIWDGSGGNVIATKILSTGSFAWPFTRLSVSNSPTLNAGRSFARLATNDSIHVSWMDNIDGNANAMLQKIGPAGGISLPSGGKSVGLMNNYYGYPKLGFNNDGVVTVFSLASNATVGIGAYKTFTNNTPAWGGQRIISNHYLYWNSYGDFTVMDDPAGCNVIFWAGFDGNVYGANVCKTNTVLPVKSGTLKAENFGQRNKISWEGYNQIAGDAYEIERSADGQRFQVIGKIPATLANNQYNFWDENPGQGNNFYRLKLTGISGNMAYSAVVKVLVNAKQMIITAYPNPFKNAITINLALQQGANGKVSIVDAFGKTLRSLEMKSTTYTLDMSGMPAGNYFIKYNDSRHDLVLKMQKTE